VPNTRFHQEPEGKREGAGEEMIARTRMLELNLSRAYLAVNQYYGELPEKSRPQIYEGMLRYLCR
jgi:hypothetical protein